MSQDVAPPLSDGRYRLVAVLGEGGMSTVYSAYDERLGVYRAIKVLTPALSGHSSIRKRFEVEARTMARLRHPNIVTVHDVVTEGRRLFIVMELTRGGSLQERLEHYGPLEPRTASDVLQQVLHALQYAHERGVVHRDIKPHNILLTREGVPKVTDFGIARVAGTDLGLTRTGAVMGTLAYMAPEQRDNASQADGRADIYSAGAALYAVLSRAEPYDLYASELHEKLFAGLPPSLVPIIQRATRYDPAQRYPTAAAMLADLAAVHGDLPAVTDRQIPLDRPLPGSRYAGTTGGFEVDDVPPAPIVPGRQPAGNTYEDDDSLPVRGELPAFPSLSGLPDDASEDFEVETGHEEESTLRIAGGARRSGGTTPAPVPRPGGGRWIWAILGLTMMSAVAGYLVLALAFGPSSGQVALSAAPTLKAAEAITDGGEATDTAGELLEIGRTPAGDGGEEVGLDEATGMDAVSTEPVDRTPTAATTPRTTSRDGSSEETSPWGSTASAREDDGSPAFGTLSINAKPKANVYVDTTLMGRTRWRGELSAGSHRVVIETDEGEKHEVSLDVPADQEIRYCWDFREAASCPR